MQSTASNAKCMQCIFERREKIVVSQKKKNSFFLCVCVSFSCQPYCAKVVKIYIFFMRTKEEWEIKYHWSNAVKTEFLLLLCGCHHQRAHGNLFQIVSYVGTIHLCIPEIHYWIYSFVMQKLNFNLIKKIYNSFSHILFHSLNFPSYLFLKYN